MMKYRIYAIPMGVRWHFIVDLIWIAGPNQMLGPLGTT